jgi:exportin-T
MQYVEQIRSSAEGGQICLELFTRNPRASEIVRHVSLEVVNSSISLLSVEQVEYFRNTLLDYARQVYGQNDASETVVDSGNLQNKLAQTLTYLFAVLFPSRWESFFDEFLALGGLDDGNQPHLPGIVLFLRVLNSVHDEIADVLVARTPDEQKRNTLLRDEVRDRGMAKTVASWQKILSLYRENDIIVEMALKVIGKWVSWIDISLVVNDALLSALFQFVGGAAAEGVRDAAINALTEIVSKKMSSADKINMIVFLNLSNLVSQIVEGSALKDARSTSDYDTDHAESVARLVNIIVLAIAKSLDEGVTTPNETSQKANELLIMFMPHVLRFFEDEYDEVSSQMIPCLTDILAFLKRDSKQKGQLDSKYAPLLSPVLRAIITKMQYDETASWGDEDNETDEAEFQEMRKRLKVLQDSIALIDEPFYIKVLSGVIIGVFDRLSRGENVNWRELDLAMYELFLFGESAVKINTKVQPPSPAAVVLYELMVKMLNSGEFSISHIDCSNIIQAWVHSIILIYNGCIWKFAYAMFSFSKPTPIISPQSWNNLSVLFIINITELEYGLGTFFDHISKHLDISLETCQRLSYELYPTFL